MKDVYIVYDDVGTEEKVKNLNLDENIYVHFLDIGSNKDRSKAFKLKGAWGARSNPFILIKEEDKVIKAFYSEVGNVFTQLTNYINNKE